MARKRYATEQIIGLLREAEVRLSQGQTIGTVCRSVGVSEQSYYRWRREYGGLKLDQAKRLKDLDRENEPAEAGGLKTDARQIDPEGSSRGKILSPSRKRACVKHVRSQLDVWSVARVLSSDSHVRRRGDISRRLTTKRL